MYIYRLFGRCRLQTRAHYSLQYVTLAITKILYTYPKRRPLESAPGGATKPMSFRSLVNTVNPCGGACVTRE